MAFPLWGTIKSYVLEAWSWLEDPIGSLWPEFRAKILGAWSWLNTIDDRVHWAALTRWTYLDTIPETIRRIAGETWSWLNSIDDRVHWAALTRWTYLDTIPETIRRIAGEAWPWLYDPIGSLWDEIRNEILGAWSWLNTIDDKIRDTASSTWSYLNTIDDRIKDISWSHIEPKLGDWFWSFIVLNVTWVSKIGYRVLSTLWSMEWDDANKEAN